MSRRTRRARPVAVVAFWPSYFSRLADQVLTFHRVPAWRAFGMWFTTL